MFVLAWSHGSFSYWRNKWHEQKVEAYRVDTLQPPAGNLPLGCWRSPGLGWLCWSQIATDLHSLHVNWCLDALHTPPPNLCHSLSLHSHPTGFLQTNTKFRVSLTLSVMGQLRRTLIVFINKILLSYICTLSTPLALMEDMYPLSLTVHKFSQIFQIWLYWCVAIFLHCWTRIVAIHCYLIF